MRMRRKPAFVLDVLVNQAGEHFFRSAELFAGVEPLLVGQPALDHFLASGLHGEVRLGERHGILGRIGVLRDQVAGVAGEGVVLDLLFLFAPVSQRNHFADFEKMVRWIVSGPIASRHRSIDHAGEIGPPLVVEYALQVAREPELGATLDFFVNQFLEFAVQSGDEFAFHNGSQMLRVRKLCAST